MKTYLLIICFFVSYLTYGQVDSIKGEILNYQDSKSDIISKGRRLLLDKFVVGDLEKVKEVKDYLNLVVADKDYAAFYPVELWLLLYWTNEYDELLDYITMNDSANYEAFQNKIKPNPDGMFQKVRSKSRDEIAALKSQIKESSLNAENKDFLVMNLYYILSDNDYPAISQENLNSLADDFLTTYPQSRFELYTRENIRYKLVTSDWGFAFEFLSGCGFFTGELKNNYTTNIPFGVAFDVEYKDIIFSLRDYIGFCKSKVNMPYSSGVWAKGSSATVFVPELSVGYSTFNGKYLRVAPFIGVASTNIGPVQADIDKIPELSEVELEFTTTWTLGITMDIKLGKPKIPMITLGPEQSYWFLRVRYSYNYPRFSKKYDGFDGSMHNITIGFGGFGRKIKREI